MEVHELPGARHYCACLSAIAAIAAAPPGAGNFAAGAPMHGIAAGRCDAFCGGLTRVRMLSTEAAMRRVKSGEATPMKRIATAIVARMSVLARRGVRQRAVFLDRDLTERHALIRPQQIDGGQNGAARGPRGPLMVALENSDQDQELADESVERRQRERRERDEQEEGHQYGHRCRKTAVLLDFVRVAAVVKHADGEEERARGDAVVEHLVDRALNCRRVEGKDSEDDEAEVAHRGVRHEALQVGLHGGDERAVDDADNRERADVRRHLVRCFRKQRHAEAQDSVRAELQHHAREDYGARRGRFSVRVGQPGVQREERHFDREGEEERAEE